MAKARLIRGTVVAAGVLLAAAAAAQPVRVGYINLDRIEKESVVSMRAVEQLKVEFEARRLKTDEQTKRAVAARDRFGQERARLSAADARAREREVSEMLRKAEQARLRFVEQLEQRKSELRAKFFQETDASIKAVAEAGKYDLIVQKATFVSSGVDVTPLVLKEMARRNPK